MKRTHSSLNTRKYTPEAPAKKPKAQPRTTTANLHLWRLWVDTLFAFFVAFFTGRAGSHVYLSMAALRRPV